MDLRYPGTAISQPDAKSRSFRPSRTPVYLSTPAALCSNPAQLPEEPITTDKAGKSSWWLPWGVSQRSLSNHSYA